MDAMLFAGLHSVIVGHMWFDVCTGLPYTKAMRYDTDPREDEVMIFVQPRKKTWFFGMYAALMVSVFSTCRTATRTDSEEKAEAAGNSAPFYTPMAGEDQLEVTPGCDAHGFTKLPAAGASELRIMEYNVENLFDAKHDKDKNDSEYLPRVVLNDAGEPRPESKEKETLCQEDGAEAEKGCLGKGSDAQKCAETKTNVITRCRKSHWSENLYRKKLKLVHEAFSSHLSAMPDILVLTEIENFNAAQAIAKELGYISTTVSAKNSGVNGQCESNAIEGVRITNSPDERGIDVALLYKANRGKLTLKSCKEIPVDVGFPTRNILQAEFDVFNGNRLVVYGNHWPSQRGGRDSAPRLKAAGVLQKAIAAQLAADPKVSIIATGDFNTNDLDEPNPVQTLLTGVQPRLYDVGEEYLKKYPAQKDQMKGTYYFTPRVMWTFLDRFLVSTSLATNGPLKFDLDSFRIHRAATVRDKQVIRVFRDKQAVDDWEKRFQADIYTPALAADAADPRVAEFFKRKPSAKSLFVTEKCGSLRTKVKDEVITGFSDHFGISALIRKR